MRKLKKLYKISSVKKNKKLIVLKRGAVCVVALGPTVGSEIDKTRPVVIISNDQMNEVSRTIMVMPITTGQYSYYTWISVSPPEGGLRVSSRIITDQVLTIDKQRIQKVIGKVSSETMRAIEQAIRNNFALPEGDILEN